MLERGRMDSKEKGNVGKTLAVVGATILTVILLRKKAPASPDETIYNGNIELKED